MANDNTFWQGMTKVLVSNSIVIDRPRDSAHPRYPDVIYPLDYGYLENTSSSDGGGIDVWLGSLISAMNKDDSKMLTGILCTFDTLKRDAEIKLLIGCTGEDIHRIQEFHKEMYALYVPNPLAST
jgi:inorganic pyrophosphatase